MEAFGTSKSLLYANLVPALEVTYDCAFGFATHYLLGLPETHRRTAAELYNRAFERKLSPLLGRSRQTELLMRALDPSFAFVALYGFRAHRNPYLFLLAQEPSAGGSINDSQHG